jgi:hypothetical protein
MPVTAITVEAVVGFTVGFGVRLALAAGFGVGRVEGDVLLVGTAQPSVPAEAPLRRGGLSHGERQQGDRQRRAQRSVEVAKLAECPCTARAGAEMGPQRPRDAGLRTAVANRSANFSQSGEPAATCAAR